MGGGSKIKSPATWRRFYWDNKYYVDQAGRGRSEFDFALRFVYPFTGYSLDAIHIAIITMLADSCRCTC